MGVARNLGTTDAPPAVRAATPGWRDPRLWIGVAIVAVSVLAGARLLGAADDSVAVWAVAGDMGAGDTVTADDLVSHRVRFTDAADLESYFRADDELPADLRLKRGVGGGELLPRAAVGATEDGDRLEVPIAVDAQQVPPSVHAGSVVDVFLVPSSAAAGETLPQGCRTRPSTCAGRAILRGVTVIDAPSLDEGFAVSGKRQLVLGLGEDDAAGLFEALGAYDNPVITVVRRG